ncbi:MAG: hypothetical protein ACI4CS_04605 [Candidatus Weimeria sp.]
MKITAKQVPVDRQTSPLYDDEEYDPRYQEAVLRTADGMSGNPELVDLLDRFAYLADDIEAVTDEVRNGVKTEEEGIKEITGFFDFSSKYNDGYTPSESIDAWEKALNPGDEDDARAVILSCLTGEEYKSVFIHGCVQRDWAYLSCPARWTDEEIDRFEAEYFNTGDEWFVYLSDDDAPFSFYTTSHDMDEIKKEITEALEGYLDEKAELTLEAFDGYAQVPRYSTV